MTSGEYLAVATLVAMLLPTNALAQEQEGFTGKVSFYDYDYRGSVASGAQYDPEKLTAAHRTLPFGTRVNVTDEKTGLSVVVTIDDRGPFVGERVLDLSLGAARALQMTERGTIEVRAYILK